MIIISGELKIDKINFLAKREIYLSVFGPDLLCSCPSQNAQHTSILGTVSIQDTVFNLQECSWL